MSQQFRQIPVKVYLSTDENAPIVHSDKSNEVLSMLRACLVDGYGDKPSLGWEIPFIDNNKITFRSQDPTSNKCILLLDATRFNRTVFCYGYQNMTSISRGSGLFRQPRANLPITRDTGNGYAMKWGVIGHEKAFIAWVFFENGSGTCLYFGDVPSFISGDTGNTILLHSNTIETYNGYNSNSSSLNFADGVFSSEWNTKTQVNIGISYNKFGTNSNSTRLDQNIDITSNPPIVTTQPVYLHTSNLPRAILSGIFWPSAGIRIQDRPESQKYPLYGFDDYLIVPNDFANTNSNDTMLVNTVSWIGT